MNVLGTPTLDDLSFVTDQTALNYIKDFPQDQEPQNFKDKFPYASDTALDLMKGMVLFNPFFRLSIEECLEHPFFEKIRRKEREVKHDSMVDVDLDKLEEEPNIQTLRRICVQEITHFKNLKEKHGADKFMDHL